MAKPKQGQCQLCKRQTALTSHHLIPRKLHRRKHFKKHFTKAELQLTTLICRDCHSAIHKFYTEMQLGKSLNTLESLHQDPQVKKHIDWVARQRRQYQ